MLKICRERVADLKVQVLELDGQSLPFEDTFDAAFSMFGLIFFPDRVAGLKSMRRALRPGAWGCVSAWLPAQRSTGMLYAMGALNAALPDFEFDGLERAEWDNAAVIQAAFHEAGFSEVEVQERVEWAPPPASPAQAWQGIAQGFAPLALARESMSDGQWQAAEARGLAWLESHPAEKQSFAALFARGQA